MLEVWNYAHSKSFMWEEKSVQNYFTGVLISPTYFPMYFV